MDTSSGSDVSMDEYDQYDGRGYLFEPEYTDEELLAQEAARIAETGERM